MLISNRDAERCHAASASSPLADQVSNCRHAETSPPQAAAGARSFRWLPLQVDAAAGSIVANNKELSNKCMYMKLCIDVRIQQQWGSTSSGLLKIRMQLMHYMNCCKLHHHGNDSKREWSTFLIGTCHK